MRACHGFFPLPLGPHLAAGIWNFRCHPIILNVSRFPQWRYLYPLTDSQIATKTDDMKNLGGQPSIRILRKNHSESWHTRLVVKAYINPYPVLDSLFSRPEWHRQTMPAIYLSISRTLHLLFLTSWRLSKSPSASSPESMITIQNAPRRPHAPLEGSLLNGLLSWM